MGEFAVLLPSGAEVLVASGDASSGGDVGFAGQRRLAGLFRSLGEVSELLVSEFSHDGLEEVEVNMGVEITVGESGLLPKLVPIGGSAQLAVTVRWAPQK